MNKQVIFMDNEGQVCAGIWNEDTNEVVCGCCGATVESDSFVLLHIYDTWIDIQEEICGDDGAILHEIEEKVDRLTVSEIEAILDGKKDFNA